MKKKKVLLSIYTYLKRRKRLKWLGYKRLLNCMSAKLQKTEVVAICHLLCVGKGQKLRKKYLYIILIYFISD